MLPVLWIRLWLHTCINHCFNYVCTAAGLMSAEIQAKTRALQRAGLFTTLSHQQASLADGVDPSDKTLAARVHLRLVPFRLNGCGAHVFRNPDRNTRSTGGWAPSHVIKPGGTLSDGVDSSDTTLAARVHQPLHLSRLHSCGAHVCKNSRPRRAVCDGFRSGASRTLHEPYCGSLSRPRQT